MWENRQQTGFVKAFTETVKQSMLEPARFYDSITPQGSYDQPLFYALICMCLGTFFALAYQFIFQSFFSMLGSFFQLPSSELGLSVGFYFFMALASLVAAPLFCFIQLILNAAIYHLCLWALGASPNGFVATFRALCYSQGPQVLQIIPFVGSFVTLIWQLVILYNGFRKLQSASSGQALAAILFPIIFMCLFSLLFFFGIILLVFFIIFAVSKASHGV
ncbi:MAG: YIP1 family protein [Deltaproteobacteria bacterium]|nr:YIP1 family protein [Deltaproteobacteria bacterium]